MIKITETRLPPWESYKNGIRSFRNPTRQEIEEYIAKSPDQKKAIRELDAMFSNPFGYQIPGLWVDAENGNREASKSRKKGGNTRNQKST